jgi:hypothetical protein
LDNPKPTIAKLFWPSIETREFARLLRVPALAFGAFSAFIWSVIAVGNLLSRSIYGNWAMVYAILFSLISWGLYKMRREAAIVSCLFSLFGLIFIRGTIQTISGLSMLWVDILAVKGIFAYVRLGETATTSIEEKS